MTIHLPEDLKRFVQTEVQSGRFASEEAAITEAVRLLRKSEASESLKADQTVGAPEPAWKCLLNNMKDVPDEEFDRIPTDGSEQHDHYIYGVPKRPTE
jgi:putative addiction module CopG family antidote